MNVRSNEPFWLVKNGITFSVLGMDIIPDIMVETRGGWRSIYALEDR